MPDLSAVTFRGVDGHTLLASGIVICVLGLLFGVMTFTRLKNMPVHASMLEVSELIYETCKTYLVTQGRFIMVLWVFIAVIISAYYGWLNPVEGKPILLTLTIILLFSLIGIAGTVVGGAALCAGSAALQIAISNSLGDDGTPTDFQQFLRDNPDKLNKAVDEAEFVVGEEFI